MKRKSHIECIEHNMCPSGSESESESGSSPFNMLFVDTDTDSDTDSDQKQHRPAWAFQITAFRYLQDKLAA